MMGDSDRTIWATAQESRAVIVTKDADFLALSTLEPNGPAVVWIRLGNTRKGPLLQWFDTLFPEIVAALERGERLVEIT